MTRTVNVVARRPMTYRTRRLLPGDGFALTPGIARLYARVGFVDCQDEQPGAAVRPVEEAPEPRGIAALRATYERLAGSPADKRWRSRRLETEIAKLKA